MYILVNSKQVKPYEKECLEILHKAQKKLRTDQRITFQITIVGSGANKIVTKNGENGTFDLDFNLLLYKIPQKFGNNLLLLKRTIRQTIDEIIPNDYSHGKDSTSAITYVRSKNNQIEFHFDIGLIRANKKGHLQRLVYEDSAKQILTWNKIFNIKNINQKTKLIRKHNAFAKVKERYVKLKNQNLSRQNDIPSYSLYSQAINDVYQSL